MKKTIEAITIQELMPVNKRKLKGIKHSARMVQWNWIRIQIPATRKELKRLILISNSMRNMTAMAMMKNNQEIVAQIPAIILMNKTTKDLNLQEMDHILINFRNIIPPTITTSSLTLLKRWNHHRKVLKKALQRPPKR